jgi:hypothetical protein
MSWLVYAQLHPARPEPAAAQDRASAPFETEDLRPETTTYRNPLQREQPIYAPQVQPVQYYQQPVLERDAPVAADYNSNYYAAANSPTYSEPVQEPAAVPADYYYVPQYYPYYAIANQVIVTNDSYRRRNRCEPPTRGNFPPGQIPHQPPDRGHHGICPGPAPLPPGTVPLPPVKAPVPPQSQGVKPPRNIAPPINPVQPRKVMFPGPPRTVRPSAAAP